MSEKGEVKKKPHASNISSSYIEARESTWDFRYESVTSSELRCRRFGERRQFDGDDLERRRVEADGVAGDWKRVLLVFEQVAGVSGGDGDRRGQREVSAPAVGLRVHRSAMKQVRKAFKCRSAAYVEDRQV